MQEKNEYEFSSTYERLINEDPSFKEDLDKKYQDFIYLYHQRN